MHETKFELAMRYGLRCMICGEEMNIHRLQWHHMRPKYDFKRCGEEVDNSVSNGALLCVECHRLIHRYDYNDFAYQDLTDVIQSYKDIDDLK